MAGYIGRRIGMNLRQPESGFFGYMVKKFLIKRNGILEREAVRLTGIEPQHKVLELGFGPGLGLENAYPYVKDGTGMISGIDFSEPMVKAAGDRMKIAVAAGKMELTLGDVQDMPYKSNKFDRVFHCNCFYFWPDINLATREIYRVMAPESVMVTTMCSKTLEEARMKGFMECANYDPSRYMQALESAGFINVRLEELQRHSYGYEVIYAHVGQKTQTYDMHIT